MPQPIPPGFTLGIVEPEEAVAAFARRSLIEVSFSWLDLWNEEHARAFTVSRLTEERLLEFIRDELAKAVKEGTRFEDWAKVVRPRLEEAGWWGTREVIERPGTEPVSTTFDPQRLALIFQVNTRQSYAAGRWARIERSKDTLPLVIYNTMRDERVRASHRPWDGLALPVDHPFWQTHFPPNGWRCRCTAYATDEEGLNRLRKAGLPVKTEAPPERWVPFVNKRTGEISQVPYGVDPGFGYNPGQAGGGVPGRS